MASATVESLQFEMDHAQFRLDEAIQIAVGAGASLEAVAAASGLTIDELEAGRVHPAVEPPLTAITASP